MSKKHFNALAWELANVRPSPAVDGQDEYRVWRRTVEAVAIVCCESNSAFDLGRFMDACHGEALIRDGKRRLVPAKQVG